MSDVRPLISAGHHSLYNNTTGSSNSAVGLDALYNNTSGTNNAGFGLAALSSNTNGDNNTALGASAYFDIGTLDNTICIGFNAGGVNDLSNHVEIGNTSANWIGGEVGWSTYSDGRIKKEVTENVPGLSFISRLRPVTYTIDLDKQNEMVYSDPSRNEKSWEGKYDIEQIRFSGFIAQEVEEAALASGYEFSGIQKPGNSQGLYSLRYSDFVMPMVKSIQELNTTLQAEVANLAQENQQLRSELDEIRMRLSEVEKMIGR